MRLLRKWIVLRTIWPYPEGWGVCSRDRRTILETGLTKEQAQRICDRANDNKETARAHIR